jgi:hypothetical protein
MRAGYWCVHACEYAVCCCRRVGGLESRCEEGERRLSEARRAAERQEQRADRAERAARAADAQAAEMER